MSEIDNRTSGLMLVMFIAGLVVAWIATMLIDQSMWHYDLVKRGVAEYNQTTGEWQYKAQYRIPPVTQDEAVK